MDLRCIGVAASDDRPMPDKIAHEGRPFLTVGRWPKCVKHAGIWQRAARYSTARHGITGSGQAACEKNRSEHKAKAGGYEMNPFADGDTVRPDISSARYTCHRPRQRGRRIVLGCETSLVFGHRLWRLGQWAPRRFRAQFWRCERRRGWKIVVAHWSPKWRCGWRRRPACWRDERSRARGFVERRAW